LTDCETMEHATFDYCSSEKHLRKLERERRLVEINQCYEKVVIEAKQKHDRIYNTVFNHGAEMDEDDLAEMHRLAQFRVDQRKKGNAFTRLMRLRSEEPSDAMMPFVVQSYSAGASLPTPAYTFSVYNEGNTGELPCETFKKLSPVHVYWGTHNRRIAILSMAIVLMIGLIVTLSDLREFSPSTKENMNLIKSVLAQENVDIEPLSKKKSPQYEALIWLVKEMESGKLHLKNLEKKSIVSKDDFGKIISINEAYSQKRELLERFVLVTLFKATTSHNTWLKDDEWAKQGLSVCSGWFGVHCAIIPDGEPHTSVVTQLRLSGNQMKGPIPHELGYLSSLTTLHLDGNSLTGTLPNGFGELTNLESLRINENSLTGIVPDSICKLKDEGVLKEIESSCGSGSDEIECSCCSECI